MYVSHPVRLFSMAASDSGKLSLPSLWASFEEFLERPEMLKARRIGFHVVRAAKKFVVGTGNAAWVMGTTMLVMVMPLVFEIDREQQSLEWEAGGAMPPAAGYK